MSKIDQKVHHQRSQFASIPKRLWVYMYYYTIRLEQQEEIESDFTKSNPSLIEISFFQNKHSGFPSSHNINRLKAIKSFIIAINRRKNNKHFALLLERQTFLYQVYQEPFLAGHKQSRKNTTLDPPLVLCCVCLHSTWIMCNATARSVGCFFGTLSLTAQRWIWRGFRDDFRESIWWSLLPDIKDQSMEIKKKQAEENGQKRLYVCKEDCIDDVVPLTWLIEKAKQLMFWLTVTY